MVALSRSAEKEAEARGFGAAGFVVTSDAAQMQAARGTFDVILNTASGRAPPPSRKYCAHGSCETPWLPATVAHAPGALFTRRKVTPGLASASSMLRTASDRHASHRGAKYCTTKSLPAARARRSPSSPRATPIGPPRARAGRRASRPPAGRALADR